MDVLRAKSLSNRDLFQLFDNRIRIVTYSKLSTFNSLDDLFGPYDVVFILYEIRPKYGHWCVICRTPSTVYFFDPYGMFPDDQLQYTPDLFRMTHGMDRPVLTQLLIESPMNVRYNQHMLQNPDNPSVATCGRWCALYALLYQYISIDEFADIFQSSGMDPDDAITLLTNFV